jgi:hypothetical protein
LETVETITTIRAGETAGGTAPLPPTYRSRRASFARRAAARLLRQGRKIIRRALAVVAKVLPQIAAHPVTRTCWI